MKSAIPPSELKSLLTTAAKRQSLLGVVPPAARAIPLAGFVVADVIERRYGENMLSGLLGGATDRGETGDAAIGLPEASGPVMEIKGTDTGASTSVSSLMAATVPVKWVPLSPLVPLRTAKVDLALVNPT